MSVTAQPETTPAPRGHQIVYDRNGQIVVRGDCTRVLASYVRPADMKGARVLDMGSNHGGLALELARLGAKVVAAEPLIKFDKAKEIATSEGLNVEWRTEGLFDTHRLGKLDVIICFGLLYHFRNPQYVLDYISSLNVPILYLSCQTRPGEHPMLLSRAIGHRQARGAICGFTPTHIMLRDMLTGAGYEEIELMTDREYNLPNPPPGATNSAYYRAVCKYPADPKWLNETFEAHWPPMTGRAA